MPKVANKPKLYTIEVPLGEVPEGDYRCRHVDLQMDQGQSDMLSSLLRGLQESIARLLNGRIVANHADALRWLLEGPARAAMSGRIHAK